MRDAAARAEAARIRENYWPSFETQARLLLLLEAFGGRNDRGGVETVGEPLLKGLDLLLTNPAHLDNVLTREWRHGRGRELNSGDVRDVVPHIVDREPVRSPALEVEASGFLRDLRFGEVRLTAGLRALIGRGLVRRRTHPESGYQVTRTGAELARDLRADDGYSTLRERIDLMRSAITWTPGTLKHRLMTLAAEDGRTHLEVTP